MVSQKEQGKWKERKENIVVIFLYVILALSYISAMMSNTLCFSFSLVIIIYVVIINVVIIK